MFLDPTQGITRLDKQLADYIAKEYKPCIFTINKWDLMVNDQNDPSQGNMARFANVVQHAFRNMSYMPLAFITAQTGKNVKALLNLGQSLFKQANRRVGTGTLNRVLREAVEAHAPAMRENRSPRIYYATQVGTSPPTIVLFVNSTRLFDATYQRYLLNVFREKLPFRDIPIKLYLSCASRPSPAPAARRMATTKSSTSRSWRIIHQRTPAPLPTPVRGGLGPWTVRSMSCSRILTADRRKGGGQRRHAGDRESRRDHGNAAADSRSRQGRGWTELRRQPRYRKLPRRRPLR